MPETQGQPAILLASSSPYRARQLKQLIPAFDQASPDIDETPQEGESPESICVRLSKTKAAALSGTHPDHWIIGSDQLGVCDGKLLTKSGNHAAALAQLTFCQGKEATFFTGLCLMHPASGWIRVSAITTRLRFRNLSEMALDAYLKTDEPYDCAGSFKLEQAGIRLFESVQSDDPSAITGLPLIRLCDYLAEAGLHPK